MPGPNDPDRSIVLAQGQVTIRHSRQAERDYQELENNIIRPEFLAFLFPGEVCPRKRMGGPP